jgi:hypothetical protein
VPPLNLVVRRLLSGCAGIVQTTAMVNVTIETSVAAAAPSSVQSPDSTSSLVPEAMKAMRILALVTVGTLCGCTSVTPRGVYINDCITHATVGLGPTSCMTRAEYRTARKQARRSQSQATTDNEEIEEIKAREPRSKIGIP